MKALAVSLVLALGLAAPALAEPAKPATPAVAKPVDAQPAIDNPANGSGDVIDDVSTPEARRALMVKCGGPPMPRKPAVVAKAEKLAEPTNISLDPDFK